MRICVCACDQAGGSRNDTSWLAVKKKKEKEERKKKLCGMRYAISISDLETLSATGEVPVEMQRVIYALDLEERLTRQERAREKLPRLFIRSRAVSSVQRE